MFCNKPFSSRIRRGVVQSLFVLFLACSISCKTVERQSGSVDLEEPDHDKATLLLEKINQLNEQGKYAEAIPHAKTLLVMVEKEKGPNHQAVGVCLNILGGLYNSIGDYEKANSILTRALEIHEKLGAENDPMIAASLGLLAKVYIDKGEYHIARPFAERALLIREKSRESDHFMVSTSLNTLGEIYLNLHEYEKAEPLLLRAIAIRKKHENAHSLVISLNNLCHLYYSSGDYESARQIGTTALELGEYALGEDHPHIAETLNLLGKISASEGKFQEAFDFMKRAQKIDSKSIDHMKGYTSEIQKIGFVNKIQGDFHVFLSLILTKLSRSSEALNAGMNAILSRKGIVLEVQKGFQRALVSGDERAINIFDELSAVRSRLTRLAFSGPGKKTLEAYREEMRLLRAEKERLEIQLSSYSRAYTIYMRKSEANCKNIADCLNRDRKSALVEFIRLNVYNFDKDRKKTWGKARYFAFILLPGNPYEIRIVDLGDAHDIDESISLLKKAVSKRSYPKDTEILNSAGRLYEVIFSQIKSQLGDIQHIYLSPDGNLNLIPFEIFYDPGKGYLIEDYTFNYVNSGRDIFGFGKSREKGGKAVIMGDPDFDMKAAEKTSELNKAATSELKEEGIVKRSVLMRGLHFDHLPETREEVQTIQTLLGKDKAELYLGKEAVEEVLLQKKAPAILHLATHGFFLEDIQIGPLKTQASGRGLQQVKMAKKKPKSQRIKIENPLLQSGIVLAGANNALKSADSRSCHGIVTAEKILGLRLRGTDMVVLSACETGMGEVKTGEGVFGLRRAFTQAGARSLVMSMWSVPDKETKELMVQFYKNIQSGKMNRCQALRQAVLKEIKIVKEKYGHSNPFFWGAFVFLGEP